MAASDARSSLNHILVTDNSGEDKAADETVTAPGSPHPVVTKEQSAEDAAEDEDELARDQGTPQYSSLTQTIRRNANGSVSSVFSGNKIRHLKKEDGVPLWRKDIQFDFLNLIFRNDLKVFTRLSDGSYGHTFAEIYVDTLATSSKTSKILKEKLAQDQHSAMTMAMVCLLVNVGRMNTTLNFFPEMRAQLRTYHSIPALQAYQDPHAYKQLQDAPRLKSILKGASEDDPQPGTMEEVRITPRPRTNAVHLVFLLAQYAPKVSEMHFTPPGDFFDLIMRHTLSSASRARAFLWIMWWYLESDFTEKEALENPFGPGNHGEGTEGLPVKVPTLETLTEEQSLLENVDTVDEKAFGEAKRKERITIVASDPSPAMTALKRARKAGVIFKVGYVPDGEGTTPVRDFGSPVPLPPINNTSQPPAGSERGSPSPPGSTRNGVGASTKGETAAQAAATDTPSRAGPVKPKGPGRGNWRRNKFAPTTSHAERPRAPAPRDSEVPIVIPGDSILPASVFQGPLGPTAAPTAAEVQAAEKGSRRSRPLTTHQLAISEYRKSRIRRILERGLQKGQCEARKERTKKGSILRSWERLAALPSGWDSEEEEATAADDKKDEEKRAALESEGPVTMFGKEIPRKDMVTRPDGGVWMAGFVLPDNHEFRDFGEEYGHFGRVLKATELRLQDKPIMSEDRQVLEKPKFVRRKSLVEMYADDLQRDMDMGDRPRLVRKPMAPQRGRNKRRSTNTRNAEGEAADGDGDVDGDADADAEAEDATKEAEAEDDEIDLGNMSALGPIEMDDEDDDGDEDGDGDVDGDGDGDEMDVDGDGDGQGPDLDEEDRELLGEVDADSEDEEDQDQEDAMDQS